MTSADVSLKSDRPSRLRFAHSPLKAAAFTLISLGFAVACWYLIRDEQVARMLFTGFALLFVFAGVFGIFWRMEMDIDLVNRRVRIRRGMWPAPKTRIRSLDDADGVWLTMEYRSSGSKSKRKVPWWFVSLKFPEERRGTRIFAARTELEGYRKLEHYARRLQLDAVDGTAEQLRRRSWQQLDEKVGSQKIEADSARVASPEPPPDSNIELISNHGRKEILLPAAGFNGGLVLLALFGGVFIVLGAGVLLAAAGAVDVQVEGSKVALMTVPPVFILAGAGIIWLGIRGSYSATVVGVSNGALFVDHLAFGKRSGRRSIPLADIESIGIGGDVRSRHRVGFRSQIGAVGIGGGRYRERQSEVVVRSDQQILRVGSRLTDAERAWLADACRHAAVEGRLP